MTQPATQTDLFANTDSARLVDTRKPKPTISRNQREFTHLTKKIQHERERLLDAEQRLAQFRQRLLESMQPVHKRLREAQWQLALGIDQWLDAKERGARLSRRDRDNLESVIATLIDELLDRALHQASGQGRQSSAGHTSTGPAQHQFTRATPRLSGQPRRLGPRRTR